MHVSVGFWSRFRRLPITHNLSRHVAQSPSPSAIPYGKAATRLRVPVPEKPDRLSNAEGVGGGPEGRMMQLRRSVSHLFDEERIELPCDEAREIRLYAERLIQEAVISSYEQDNELLLKYWIESDPNRPVHVSELPVQLDPSILEMTVFWLSTVHLTEKLFKVFVPRYRHYNGPYTRLHRLPQPHYPFPHNRVKEGYAVLELHGNPWPPIRTKNRGLDSEPFKHNYLINVLIAAAKNQSGKTSN